MGRWGGRVSPEPGADNHGERLAGQAAALRFVGFSMAALRTAARRFEGGAGRTRDRSNDRVFMSEREPASRLEFATIQPIPLGERHGTYGDLFTVWFGSNLMLLTIVTGGLAGTVFWASFRGG